MILISPSGTCVCSTSLSNTLFYVCCYATCGSILLRNMCVFPSHSGTCVCSSSLSKTLFYVCCYAVPSHSETCVCFHLTQEHVCVSILLRNMCVFPSYSETCVCFHLTQEHVCVPPHSATRFSMSLCNSVSIKKICFLLT